MALTFRKRVKRYLPSRYVDVARRWNGRAEAAAMRTAGKSRLLSYLYFGNWVSPFRREFYAVAYGRRMFNQSLQGATGATYFLRRSAHRIEKGLISRPRRSLFALDYIGQTVSAYRTEVERLSHDADLSKVDLQSLNWVTDVLGAYFDAVDSSPVTDSAREVFLEARALYREPDRVPESQKELVPYPFSSLESARVSYEDFLALSWRRRSVRWFEPKAVPRDSLDKAVAAASLSPSACNRQPYEFRIFDEPELVKKVAAVPMGTRGFSDNFPAVVVLIGRQRAYANHRDRHIIYIDGSLAAMSFIYALETMGLSSCAINWPDMEPQESAMAKLLGLEPDERVIMLIAVGYADPEGLIPYSQKLALDRVRSYNRAG
ncbi:nitroreductase family protein [Mycolicibacterium tokaiense]|nr:nitroreductase family protein [Mycolicibacterium tokaiense]